MITGAGRGIGRAIAVAFGKAHAEGVILLGRTQSTLDETAAEVKDASGGKTEPFVATADFMIQSQVQAAMDTATEHFSGHTIDVLVNNAGGVVGSGNLADVNVDEFMQAFDFNVRGPLNVLQAFIRESQKHSPNTPRTVISLPSGAAHLPYAPTAASYACSKLANAKMIEYLHYEHSDWNVFNMQPGVVDTDLARAAGRKAPDKPALPAAFAVWLASDPRAKELNGKFMWANWDIEVSSVGCHRFLRYKLIIPNNFVGSAGEER